MDGTGISATLLQARGFRVSDHGWSPRAASSLWPLSPECLRFVASSSWDPPDLCSLPRPLSGLWGLRRLRLPCSSQVRLVEAWVQGKDRPCLMASLRRVKVLLVLNLIAVAGFVIFLAKCRPIAVRSGDAFHEIRPRAEVANLSAHSASPIQDAVLKRLSLLEDIVYRQLNGKDVP